MTRRGTIASVVALLLGGGAIAASQQMASPSPDRRSAGTPVALPALGDPDAVADAERRALGDARAQAVAARARSALYEQQAQGALTDAQRAARQAAAVAARIQAIEAERVVAEADVRAADARLRRVMQAIDARREPLMRLTASLQALSRRPMLSVLAEPGDLGDLVHSRAVLLAALPVVRERTRALRRDVAMLGREQEGKRLALATLRRSVASLDRERATLSALETQRRVTARRLDGASLLEAERATGLAERARDIVDLLGTVEGDAATRDRLASLPGPVLRPDDPASRKSMLVAIGLSPGSAEDAVQATAERGPAGYRLPVVGRIVAGLGEVAPSGVRSRGLTIAVAPGAQVVAPAGGRVAFAGAYRGYGRIVIIDHGEGWISLVTGLNALGTAVGRMVVPGEPIGRAGREAPRITVELRRAGQVADIATIASQASPQ